MAEITAPIIGITLVLLSVFVPVAFIPGISGELFRQFAVTVAVSMFLSAINALTLSPALCAVLLQPHHGPRRGVIGLIMCSIDHVRDAYGAVVARIVRLSVIGLAMVAVAGFGVVGLAKITPTGFLPEDDQGALFVAVEMPGGASVARTTEAVHQAEDILREEEAVADVTSVIGLNFIDNYSQPNAAFIVVTLKPFEERKARALGVPELIARLSAKFRQIQGGTVVPLAPPPILGLGTGGGFTYVLQDLRGGTRKRWPRPCAGSPLRQPGSAVDAGVQHILRHEPVDLSRYRSQQGADSRRAIERRVPGAAGIAGRVLRERPEPVRPQVAGERSGRGQRPGEYRRHLSDQRAQRRGEDDPPAQPAGGSRRRGPAGAHPLQQSARSHRPGQPRARRFVGTGAQSDGRRRGPYASIRLAGEWTDTAFQEKRAEGKTTIILGFAVLFAYLFLVGLYESWTIPVPVLLSVSVGVLGSFAASSWAGSLSISTVRSA